MTAAALAESLPERHVALARFEAFYVACHLRVLGLLRHGLAGAWQSRVGGWDESGGGVSPEELAQETWLRLWRQWPALLAGLQAGRLSDQALATYALTTAHRVLIDQQRRRQMRRRNGECALSAEGWELTEAYTPDPARDGQPEARTLAAEALGEALAVLRALPQNDETRDQFGTLVVAMATGEPLAATAQQLGVPISSVKMREHRLRQALRAWRAETAEAEEAV